MLSLEIWSISILYILYILYIIWSVFTPVILSLSFTGLSVDTTSSWRRTKRSPSGQFPVKNPTSETKIGHCVKNFKHIITSYWKQCSRLFSPSRIVQGNNEDCNNNISTKLAAMWSSVIWKWYTIWCKCVFKRKYMFF